MFTGAPRGDMFTSAAYGRRSTFLTPLYYSVPAIPYTADILYPNENLLTDWQGTPVVSSRSQFSVNGRTNGVVIRDRTNGGVITQPFRLDSCGTGVWATGLKFAPSSGVAWTYDDTSIRGKTCSFESCKDGFRLYMTGCELDAINNYNSSYSALMADGLNFSAVGATDVAVYFQRGVIRGCRGTNALHHADCIQNLSDFAGNVYVSDSTLFVHYQGILAGANAYVLPANWWLRRMNFRLETRVSTGTGAPSDIAYDSGFPRIWVGKSTCAAAAGTWTSTRVPVDPTNGVYVEGAATAAKLLCFPNSTTGCNSTDNTTYMTFDAGGTAGMVAGSQMMLASEADNTVAGRYYYGVPPLGDYATVGQVGVNYVG